MSYSWAPRKRDKQLSCSPNSWITVCFEKKITRALVDGALLAFINPFMMLYFHPNIESSPIWLMFSICRVNSEEKPKIISESQVTFIRCQWSLGMCEHRFSGLLAYDKMTLFSINNNQGRRVWKNTKSYLLKSELVSKYRF